LAANNPALLAQLEVFRKAQTDSASAMVLPLPGLAQP
jgi:hypothetical protein